MKNKTKMCRLLALLLSVLMLFACMPVSAAEAEPQAKFVSENLFQTHLESSHEAVFYGWNSGESWNSDSGTFPDVARFDEKGALAGSVDGDTSKAYDVYAYSDTSTNLIGARYHLDAAYFVGELKLYSGFADNKDIFRVYASDTLENLYSADSVVTLNAACDGSGTTVAINRTIKYISIFFDNVATTDETSGTRAGDGMARVIEFQLWSGDKSSIFIPENLFQTHLESKHEALFYGWNNGESWDKETGAFPDVARFDEKGALDGSVDGDTSKAYDVYAYSDTNTNLIGARYHLDAAYFVGELKLYSGLADNKDIFRVYASDTLENLYGADNVVTLNAACDGSGTTVAINRTIKYISIFFDNVATTDETSGTRAGDGMARVIEFQLWSGDKSSIFIPENLFQTHLESKHEALFYGWNNGEAWNNETGTFPDVSRFDEKGALDGSVDGDTSKAYDVYAYGDTNTNLIGARYHLDAAYFVGELKLYSGLADNKDIFRVYASDTLENLYRADNAVTLNAACDGSGTTVTINRTIKYISIFFDNVATTDETSGTRAGDGMARVIEFQLWTGDISTVFIPENLLQTDLASATTNAMYVSSGGLLESDKFDQKGALAGSTDGNLTTTYPVYDCIDGWEYPIYPGVVYTLNENHYVSTLNLYANGTVKVYASDALDTLYSAYNCVADNVVATTSGLEIKLNKYVKYLAIFCNKYVDVAEFQLWSGDPATAPPVSDTDALKVLTIGNSFSENASVYASKIAYENGLALTFGYLKFPSCTIAQHLEAAQNDLAVFKFEITAPDGARTTLKNEASAFNAPNADNCATIKEALEYTEWDVIVFQQESFTSLDASTFASLPQLINYVKGYCPDAKLMIHEVWAWGTWQNDNDKNFAKIKASYEAAATANDLAIIPSGLAFEKAREAVGDYSFVNENDGLYQHANSYGQYLAGASYVATLFGIEIPADNFVDNTEVNQYVAQLNAAVNAAVKYYNSYGDLDQNGEIEADDLTALKQHLLSVKLSDTTIADANYDGKVDICDFILLKKHLSDESVNLGPTK